MGVELVVGAVELRVAAAADVSAGLVEVIVLAGEGRFGAFGLDDVPLARCELVVLRTFHGGATASLDVSMPVYRDIGSDLPQRSLGRHPRPRYPSRVRENVATAALVQIAVPTASL